MRLRFFRGDCLPGMGGRVLVEERLKEKVIDVENI